MLPFARKVAFSSSDSAYIVFYLNLIKIYCLETIQFHYNRLRSAAYLKLKSSSAYFVFSNIPKKSIFVANYREHGTFPEFRQLTDIDKTQDNGFFGRT